MSTARTMSTARLRIADDVIEVDWSRGTRRCVVKASAGVRRELTSERVWVPWGDPDDLTRYLVVWSRAHAIAYRRGLGLVEEGELPGPADLEDGGRLPAGAVP